MNITPLTAIARGISGRNSLLANSSPKGVAHNDGKECWRAEGAGSWPKSPWAKHQPREQPWNRSAASEYQ
jgi:hypothetical protein